jgi:hypothetical protein
MKLNFMSLQEMIPGSLHRFIYLTAKSPELQLNLNNYSQSDSRRRGGFANLT